MSTTPPSPSHPPGSDRDGPRPTNSPSFSLTPPPAPTSTLPHPQRPSLRTLGLMAVGFAGLLAFLLHFSIDQIPHIRQVPPQTNAYSLLTLHLSPSDPLPPAIDHWVQSPTLFALPSLNGFSGSAWMRYSPPPLPLDVSTSEAHWVPFSTNEIGGTLAQLSDRNRPTEASVSEQQIPWRDNFPVDTTPSGRSTLRREGPIALRLMMEPEKIPTWTHPDVLLDTHVQVLVDPAGRTLTASLVDPPGTSGTRLLAPGARSAAAEQFALDYARRARYARTTPYLAMDPPTAGLRPDQLTWGYLIFRWHTVPPAGTNTTTSASSIRL